MNLPTILLTKILEQVKTTENLICRIPPDRMGWRPMVPVRAGSVFRVEELLGHLLECAAGFCAVLQKVHPAELAHFEKLRPRRRNHRCGPAEAQAELKVYLDHVKEGFQALADDDLERIIPTVFAPEGQTVLTILLSNLEHLIHHKYQLFIYLKMMGIPVGTKDLYGLG
jgi:uncharacterized damage-inducible protein DinB